MNRCFNGRILRSRLGCRIEADALGPNAFCDFYARSSLGLSGLSAYVAGDDRRPIRKVDQFFLPLVYGWFKVKDVESPSSNSLSRAGPSTMSPLDVLTR